VTLLAGLTEVASEVPAKPQVLLLVASTCMRWVLATGYHVAMTPTLYVTAPLGTVAHSDPERLHRSCTD
jgi:hypothetical protein